MSKTKSVLVKKTDKLNQRKLNRIARQYGITPINVRELQLGYPEKIPVEAAELLIADGFVTKVKGSSRTAQEKVDALTTESVNSIVTTEDSDIDAIDDNDSINTDSPNTEEYS